MENILKFLTFRCTDRYLDKLNINVSTKDKLVLLSNLSLICINQNFAYDFKKLKFINGSSFLVNAEYVSIEEFVKSLGNFEYDYIAIAMLEDIILGKLIDKDLLIIKEMYLDMKAKFKEKYFSDFSKHSRCKSINSSISNINLLFNNKLLNLYGISCSDTNNNNVKVSNNNFIVLDRYNCIDVDTLCICRYNGEYTYCDPTEILSDKEKYILFAKEFIKYYLSNYLSILPFEVIDNLIDYLYYLDSL